MCPFPVAWLQLSKAPTALLASRHCVHMSQLLTDGGSFLVGRYGSGLGTPHSRISHPYASSRSSSESVHSSSSSSSSLPLVPAFFAFPLPLSDVRTALPNGFALSDQAGYTPSQWVRDLCRTSHGQAYPLSWVASSTLGPCSIPRFQPYRLFPSPQARSPSSYLRSRASPFAWHTPHRPSPLRRRVPLRSRSRSLYR